MNPITELVVHDSPEHGPIHIHVHWLDAVSLIAARWAKHKAWHDHQYQREMKELWGTRYDTRLDVLKGEDRGDIP